MLACWIEDPNSEAFKLHVPRIYDYLWLAEDGMKMKVTIIESFILVKTNWEFLVTSKGYYDGQWCNYYQGMQVSMHASFTSHLYMHGYKHYTLMTTFCVFDAKGNHQL
jgi:hypothetical protein